MNWQLLLHALWHGIFAAIITAATVVGTYQQAPQGWQWAGLIVGLLVSFAKGVEGFFREPTVGS